MQYQPFFHNSKILLNNKNFLVKNNNKQDIQNFLFIFEG